MHTIRLRGPWDCRPREEGRAGAIRCSRGFHTPTGLDAKSKVWLVVDPLPSPALVNLNGTGLGPVPGRYEVAHLLGARNDVVVEVDGSPEDELPTTLDGVRLEIEDG